MEKPLQSLINRAVVYSDPGVSLETAVVGLPVQQPAEGEVLVKLHYSGVCHTDVSFCMNALPGLRVPTPKGQIGGHEGVGIVVAHGPGVASPPIGCRVGIKYAADACLTCDNCVEGAEASCLNGKVSGYFTPGTFQQYCIATARYVTPIPASLDLAAAAPLMCGGVTVYTALRKAGLRPGDWVAIFGAGGGLGHLAIQYAKAMGGRVIALDVGQKKDFCLSQAADEFVDITQFDVDEDAAAKVKLLSNGGVRISLQCTSSSQAYTQAFSSLGFRGTLVCIGVPQNPLSFAPNISAMVGQELKIISAKTGNRVDVKECLNLAARGLVNCCYQIRKMDELTEVFEEMQAGLISGRAILDLEA
ncbi:GroES-like protein [Trichoderma chlorosporum]